MVKTILLFAVLVLLVGCSTPPATVTSPPPITVNPGASTDTPAVPTNSPAVSTDTPAVPTTSSGDAAYLPNPAWQPGAYNPDVTQDNIQTTICVSGYTAKIRPPVSYTDALKKQQIVQYGYSDTNLADYEEDHLVALEDGGHPTDPHNLWPQPRHAQQWNAPLKDTLENVLHGMVCSGQLTLDTARQALATDWVEAYRKYVPQSLFALTPVPPEP
jgi:hypothetical protein